MTTTQKNNIILKAWETISEDSKIKKIYFLPWVISIIFLTIILVYQSIYTYVVLFNQKEKALSIILQFFHSDYFTEAIVGGIIFLVIYIIFVPFYDGLLVWYLNKKEENPGEEIKLSESIGNGLYRFLPMFEYSNIFSQFKFITVINSYLFCLRFIGVQHIKPLSIAFVILLAISVIINLLCAYCKYEIVLNNQKAFESISNSAKITFLNLWLTIKIYFFMFIVNVRVIINFLVFLMFPIIIVSAITYISSKIFLTITVTILSIIFIFFILILGYLWGVMEIFKSATRYYAYREGRKKLEENEKPWH